MAFARVPVEEMERLSVRTSQLRDHRAVPLGVVALALALTLASCKKSETATPADQAPADTAITSQSAAPPAPPASDAASAPETASSTPAAPEAPDVAASRPASAGAAESLAAATRAAAAPPAARRPSVKTAEASPAPAPVAAAKPAPAAPAPTAAPAPAPPAPAAPTPAPAPAPESKAAADTPSTAGRQADTGGQAPKASLDATPEVYEGWKYFSANCERCHGQDAVGSSFAPSLIHSIREGSVLGTGPLTHDVYIGTMVAGRPARGMPSWVQLLDHDKMENIWAYLTARASGKLAPGRPIKQGG